MDWKGCGFSMLMQNCKKQLHFNNIYMDRNMFGEMIEHQMEHNLNVHASIS